MMSIALDCVVLCCLLQSFVALRCLALPCADGWMHACFGGLCFGRTKTGCDDSNEMEWTTAYLYGTIRSKLNLNQSSWLRFFAPLGSRATHRTIRYGTIRYTESVLLQHVRFVRHNAGSKSTVQQNCVVLCCVVDIDIDIDACRKSETNY